MTGIVGEQAGQRSHARRNHEVLVATAREVFAERGVEASLEEIARRAGVGIGTLYRHFATRDALIEAVFERRIGAFVAIAEQAADEPDAWQAFTGLLEQMLELQSGDRMLKDVLWRSAPGAERAESARAQLRGLFEQVLERAHAQGRLRADFGFPDLAVLLWSFAPLIEASGEVGSNVWARHLHLVLDGLRADSATPQSEPPLSDETMRVLRERRLGRRRAGGGGLRC
jgi:AcrR family transcriptional regulator